MIVHLIWQIILLGYNKYIKKLSSECKFLSTAETAFLTGNVGRSKLFLFLAKYGQSKQSLVKTVAS